MKGITLKIKDSKMKKMITSILMTAAIFTFSTETDARGSGPNDFRYYHYQCLDSNNKQLWFEISSTYNFSLAARCSSDGGTLRVTKVFW